MEAWERGYLGHKTIPAPPFTYVVSHSIYPWYKQSSDLTGLKLIAACSIPPLFQIVQWFLLGAG